LDASTWAAIVVAIATVLATIIALAGYLWGNRGRAEEKAEKFGRIEGWADAAGNRRAGGDNQAYAMGGFGEAIKNIQEDIKEIRRVQREDESGRSRFRDDITAVKNDIQALKTAVQAVARRVNRRGIQGGTK
jgi:hypothetical protein